jgi:restriction endonuclease S subunit
MTGPAMSDIPTGYKQTEVGVIPEDWEIRHLGSFCEISAGRDLVKEEFAADSDHRHKFPIYSNAVKSGGLYGYSKSYQYGPDKITVTARGDIGHALYRSTSFCAIGRLLVLSSTHSCDLRFVTEFINHYVDFAIESTGVPQLTVPQISGYAVALPPTKAEQEAIAEALSDADAYIESLEQLLAKKRQIKQGAMQELITGKKRLPGYSGEWDVKRLDDVTDIDPDNLGSDIAADYAFNYVSLEDVDHGVLRDYSEQVFYAAPSRARRRLRKEDILVSTVRPNLQSHLLFTIETPHWVCSTGFSVVRCRKGVTNPGYVFSHFFGNYISRQIYSK